MRNLLKKINWRKVLNVTLWVITLTGMGFLMSFINVKSSEYACNELQITIPGDQSFVIREDIDKILKETQGSLIGKTLLAIPIHEIEEDLRTIPFVEKAIVSKDLNGKLTIEIKQRKAVLRVINNLGNDFYIDNKGLKMPLSVNYAPRVLVANGLIMEKYDQHLDSVKTDKLQELVDLANYIRADTLWDNQIEQLFVNVGGVIEMIPRVGNQKIIIGNATELDEKFAKLLLFYKQVIPSVGWDAYKTVNLSFANQLVCEKNENSQKDKSIN